MVPVSLNCGFNPTSLFDDEFDFLAVDKDEARKKREEKRNQRQKELEAKRSSRQGGGSLKLGAKKLASD